MNDATTIYLVVCDFSTEHPFIQGASTSLDKAKEMALKHFRPHLIDYLIYAMEDGKDYDEDSLLIVWRNGEDVVEEPKT